MTTRVKLPWYDGFVDGKTKVWDANNDEVDLYRYSAFIVDAVNRLEPNRSLFDSIRAFLRGQQ